MPLNVSLAGKTYPSTSYAVTAESIEKYAAATNETNPVYAGDGAPAPPAFAIVPASEGILNVLSDSDLSVNLPLLVHGEEDHRFHRPIRAGDELRVETRLATAEIKESGETFTIESRLVDALGNPVADVTSLMFIRGTGTRSRQPSGDPPQRDFVFEVEERVDEDQTYRYAEASGDHNPIHVDPEFAKNVAGLPGIIVHGMCTMAFASRAVVDELCGRDVPRLRRIKVRFSRPVFPGSTLRTRAWRELDADGTETFGFETLDDRGNQALKDGVAEVSA